MARLTAPPKSRLSCAPAVPPRAMAMCVSQWTSRCVCRARRRHRGQTFGEDLTNALGILTKPLSHPQL